MHRYAYLGRAPGALASAHLLDLLELQPVGLLRRRLARPGLDGDGHDQLRALGLANRGLLPLRQLQLHEAHLAGLEREAVLLQLEQLARGTRGRPRLAAELRDA